MRIEQLDEELFLRRKELEVQDKKECYSYIKEFVENNELESILDFLTIDIWEFIKCRFFMTCKDKNMQVYSSLIDNIKEFFSSITNNSIENVLNIIKDIYNEKKVSETISFFNSKGLFNDAKALSVLDLNSQSSFRLASFKKKLNEKDIDFVPFLNAVKENGKQVIDELSLYLIYRKVVSFCQNAVIEIDGNVTNERQLEIRKINALNRYLQNDFDIDFILEKMNEVKSYKEEYEKQEKKNNNEIISIDSSRKVLERNLDKKEILLYRDIVKGIKNQRIKYLFLRYIREHNEDYYQELKKELDIISKDSKVAIQALLNDYGFPVGSYDFKLVSRFSSEELNLILRFLSFFEITNEEKLLIVKNTSIDKVISLSQFVDRGILSIPFISLNLNLFDNDSEKLDNIMKNIEVLKSYNISLSLFLESIDVLMNNPSLISKNLDILSNYKLLDQLKVSKTFSFLTDDELEVVIDKYLELGYEFLLQENLDVLNNGSILKLEALKAIGIELDNKEDLERILSYDFGHFEDELDSFLPNDVDYVEEPCEVVSIEELEQYKITDRVYELGGVKISVEKVKRYINNGYSLYKAIVSNTHLSEEEILRIQKVVKKENNDVKSLTI